MNLWKKVTPIPIEYNDCIYLFECTVCHRQVTYLGMRKNTHLGIVLTVIRK